MGQSRSSRNRLAATAAVTAALVVTAGLAETGQASAADTQGPPGSFKAPSHNLKALAQDSNAKPQSLMPESGTHAFLLKLKTRPTSKAFAASRSQGLAAAKSAARAQLKTVRASQASVSAALPSGTRVLYKTHAATNSIAVRTDAKNVDALANLAGVKAVYPIAAKKPSNAYAVPLVGAPGAWTDFGNLGASTAIAIIDTGLDYTHANFGGPGTEAAYDTAHAAEDLPADSDLFPSAKIIGGEDFAGDAYDAGGSGAAATPHPDPNPLDCNGHGSHVAGSAAGFGENADGSTYTGDYNEDTPFAIMKIGPGMAPEAKLYAYRVFGCDGSSNVVGAAMDRAADPDGDGDTSDHVDVVNLSLGSDYGSALDGDAVQANDLAAMGVNVVIASGNGGDLYEVGGSPGNAPRALTVANSVDASSVIDALNVSAPASIAGSYGAERSIQYDYASDPDLSGTLVALSDAGNKDGCVALSPADDALLDGKVAFLEWTDDDTVRRCGSAARANRVAAAGAIGFVFADDQETFSAGISGNDLIPGVLVTKSAGDAIRDHLGEGVTVSGTTRNGFTQLFPEDNDKVNGSSSRGVRTAGGLKPDVAAVGTSVFSTEVGTGTGGMSISGTSMATPQVAGLTSLVVDKHPTWTTEEVKADIMNTAGQDLFTGDNHTGETFAPNRVGAGRIQAEPALANEVLAYVQDDPGAVSVSFGPLEVTAPVSLTKTIKVVNKGGSSATYDVSYDAITSIPGVAYSVSPSSVTVAGGQTKTVEVKLTIANPAALTKTIDPTMEVEQGGLPREFVADASGRVLLASADRPTLRVPVYSAPRPASQMTQASTLGLTPGALQSGSLALTGAGVDQGAGAAAVSSKVAAFELQKQSGLAPECAVQEDELCLHNADERSADLKYVGVGVHDSSLCGTCLDFAITTHGPMHTVASQQEFDILIDTDGDKVPDFVTFNTRLGETDVFVTATVELTSGDFDTVDVQFINDRFGDEDTAALDSDTIVMPVNALALGLTPDDARISYSVETYTGYGSVDVLGEKNSGLVDGSMSFDAAFPGLWVGDADQLLFDDQPGESLTINRDRAEYASDHGSGLLVVHFHNGNTKKAQVVSLLGKPNLTFGLSPASVGAGGAVTATVTVANTENAVPTGNVTLKTSIGKTLGSGVLDDTGKAIIIARPKPAGTYSVHAEYSGDATYAGGNSTASTLTVTKNTSTVNLKVAKEFEAGTKVVATISVKTVNGLVPTGKVTLKRGTNQLGSATLVNGKTTIKFKIATKGSFRLLAKYTGDGNFMAGTSPKRGVTVA